MNSENLGKLLVAACERKKIIAHASFIRRFLIYPRMFFITLTVRFLRFFGLTLLYKANVFWGRQMRVVLPEVVSSEIVRFGYIEEAVASAIIACLKEGDVALDVGAHFGFFSVLMAKAVGETGQVYAFEPMPSTFSILKLNSAGLPIVLNNLAMWKERANLDMYDYGLACSAFNSIRAARMGKQKSKPMAPKVSIEAITIDDYVLKKGIVPNFIKIDAESAEYEVLCGMKDTLSTARPKICIELGDLGVAGATGSRFIIDMLINYGYVPLEWQEGGFRPHTLKEWYPYTNLLFVPNSLLIQ